MITLYPLISGKGRLHHGEILRQAALLTEQGKLAVLPDDSRYPLDTVEAAHRSLEDKSARGKIVITIGA